MKRTALDIAADLERGSSKIPSPAGDVPAWMAEAAAELRRQHALILEMREALKSVNAAIYMDDAGQLRLNRSFDERVIDVAISRALNE